MNHHWRKTTWAKRSLLDLLRLLIRVALSFLRHCVALWLTYDSDNWHPAKQIKVVLQKQTATDRAFSRADWVTSQWHPRNFHKFTLRFVVLRNPPVQPLYWHKHGSLRITLYWRLYRTTAAIEKPGEWDIPAYISNLRKGIKGKHNFTHEICHYFLVQNLKKVRWASV